MSKSMDAHQKFVLKILRGDEKGREIAPPAAFFTIGRSNESDIWVSDSLISRVHCRLSVEDGRWFIEDLNSTNGTWLLGQRVEYERVPLPLKTSFRIGGTVFEMSRLHQDNATQMYSGRSISYCLDPETMDVRCMGGDNLGACELDSSATRLMAIHRFQTMSSGKIDDEDKLYDNILTSAALAMECERGFLLVYDLRSGELKPVRGHLKGRLSRECSAAAVNSGYISFVKDSGRAILAVEESAGGAAPRRSVMCAPMTGDNQANGMLYFESVGDPPPGPEELAVLVLLAKMAGSNLESLRLRQFNQRNKRLVATGTTAAGLSHYIKNILAGMDGSLNLLRMGLDERDYDLADEAWLILKKNHVRLGNMALDLLNLASDQKPLLEVHDVGAIINEVVELFKPQLAHGGVVLRAAPGMAGRRLLAEVDAKGIHRVILNLILNSEHAIAARSRAECRDSCGEIMIDGFLNERKDLLMVSVSDNGIGLDDEDSSEIFNLFISNKGSAGTGLGLAVCKRIIEAHGGSITATGKKGEGCTFIFSLPVTHNEMNTSTITFSRLTD